ncbi:MAG: Plasmid stabilization system [Candidatus Amesbacteria bacterium GW2011_GWA2_42_12]|uniref:Plasmid stabilization system n=1 Tax=Candidatus Amesbacteria bacterium GW2011_GWA2_42_12 TaxID=1618356 RepID=A0A0G0Y592_9BACT|nr:MAG: Plasmid stabilization system [Candidatus Amesbacteria bacterium GW2011_GWA2_42_12]
MAVGYFVYISKSIRKSLLRIPSPWIERIGQALDVLETDPHIGEKMAGKLVDCRKIRIWPYRIIYRLDKSRRVVEVLEIGHRGSMSYK